MILKSVLDSLAPEERARLMHAFEHQFSQHIKLMGNKFIGVNIVGRHFVVEESAGVWSYGTIRKETNG
ncbi:MAG: hypothetical protein WC942_02495 [Clostridia bacterium]|jgi:hypothetical protein